MCQRVRKPKRLQILAPSWMTNFFNFFQFDQSNLHEVCMSSGWTDLHQEIPQTHARVLCIVVARQGWGGFAGCCLIVLQGDWVLAYCHGSLF